MAWIRRYKQKKLISKISVDSKFKFSSYAWLCVFHCSHRLLCWINSRVREFLWKLLSFHTEMISAWFLSGIVLLRGELRKYTQKLNFENFESALYSTSVSMPLISSGSACVTPTSSGEFYLHHIRCVNVKKKKKKKKLVFETACILSR